jgi:hypothetical protein
MSTAKRGRVNFDIMAPPFRRGSQEWLPGIAPGNTDQRDTLDDARERFVLREFRLLAFRSDAVAVN